MEYQQNNPVTYQSEEKQQQNSFTEPNPTPPKWLNVVFKTWAILNFVVIGATLIEIAVSLKSNLKIITQLTEISISYSLILYGLYAAVFILLLVYLIPFWGTFKLRKWALPILIVLFIFSAINAIALLFKPLQFSIFAIITNLIVVAIALLAFTFRSYFTGAYKKLSLQIIFFIFTVPILTIGTLTLLFPDLEKISDLDLTQNDFLTIGKDQNSYYVLIEISNQVYEPTGQANNRYKQFVEGKIWDQTEVDTILGRNENILNKAREAATLSYYQCPSYENGFSPATEFCLVNYLQSVARITSLSALSKAQKGDFQGAIDDALIPIRIGQLIEDEPVIALVDYLFGDAMKRIGLNTVQIILTKYQIPSEILLARINELQKYTKNENGLKNAFRLEYQSEKNSIAFVNKIKSNFYIQPNRSFSDMADDTRQKMAIIDTPCYQLEITLKKYQKNFEEKVPKIVIWKLPFTRNAVFEVLKSVISIILDLSSIQNKRCESDLLVEQTRLQMALSAYKSDKGQFPYSQSELVPNYLPREVLNPYTNTAFTFNKDTGAIDQEKK